MLITEFDNPGQIYAQPTLKGYIDRGDVEDAKLADLIVEAVFQAAIVTTVKWSETGAESIRIEATRFQWNEILANTGLALDDEQITAGLLVIDPRNYVSELD